MEFYYSSYTKIDENMLRRLVRAQYSLFHTKTKLIFSFIGLILLGLGFFSNVQDSFSILLIAVGCWVIVSIDFPAHRLANKIISEYHGEFPSINYYFYPSHLLVTNSDNTDQREINYSDFILLAEDRSFNYFFLSPTSGIIISKDSLISNSSDSFSSFVESKTNLESLPFSNIGVTLFRKLLLAAKKRFSHKNTL